MYCRMLNDIPAPSPLGAIPSITTLICDKQKWLQSLQNCLCGTKEPLVENLWCRGDGLRKPQGFVSGNESLRVGARAGRMLLARMSRWVWDQISKNFKYHLWSANSPVSSRKQVGIFAKGGWQDWFCYFGRQTWSGVFSSTLCQVGNKPGWGAMGSRPYRGWCRGYARQMVLAWSQAVTVEMGTSVAIQQCLNKSDLSMDVLTGYTDIHILGVTDFKIFT